MRTYQTTTPKSKLRWYQFSLRNLLIFVTLFAIACSWFAVKMQQAERQREAVEAILKAGGGVRYDYQLAGTIIPPEEPTGPVWLRRLLGDDIFANVAEVSLWGKGTQITDADLEHLKGLTMLQELQLWGTQITDAGLEHLKGLAQLKKLDLQNTEVTDAGLVHLKGLTNLESLDISKTNVTDAGIKDLQKALPNLKITR
jgi:hypothetical protein